MQSAKIQLQIAASEAIQSVFGKTVSPDDIVVNTTNPQHNGDYTIVLFTFAKLGIGKPEEIGQQLGTWLSSNVSDLVGYTETVKGFLNVGLSNGYWYKFMNKMWRLGPNYFRQVPNGAARTIMVEYASPNTNKPLHLGHLRNIFLGWSIAEILKSAGHAVIKANLINDRGIHICKSMLAYELNHKGETPETVGKKGDHFVGDCYIEFSDMLKQESKPILATLLSQGVAEDKAKLEAEKATNILQLAEEMLRKWESGNSEVLQLWRTMNSWVFNGFEATFRRIGCDFDKYYFESNTYLLGKHIVAEGLGKGVFTRNEDGSAWVDLSGDGLDQKLLLRSDGTSVYITQDLGTAQLKFDDYGLTDSLYVIGNEQDFHMKVLKATLSKLGKPWASGIKHISYGMVELPTGRMKSREGTVVDADDLIDELEQAVENIMAEKVSRNEVLDVREKDRLRNMLAQGALKFYLLTVEPARKMVFNPEESINFDGRTGIYIQYNHARMCKIRRDAYNMGYALSALGEFPSVVEHSERRLLTHLHNFSETLNRSATDYSPSLIANYVYELAQLYSSFYNELPILKNTDAVVLNFRILLTELTRRTIEECLRLLGISSPERL